MNNRRIPKYMVLKNELLSWFESGRLQPGRQVPSEHEIADQFGVSRQTVRQTFGELEKEGWLTRIQGKGTFARNPQRRESEQVKTIGIITTYISDYIFPHIVRGAEAELRSKGYRLLLSSTDNHKEKEMESLRLMTSQPLSGLIIEPTKSAEGNPNLGYFLSLQEKGIPFLMINEKYRELECPCLKVDDELGGYLATRHLIASGHTTIAGFFKRDDLQGVNRLKGFLRAHREAGLTVSPDRVITYTTEQKGELPYSQALTLLHLPYELRPTGLVCYNDELAVSLIEATGQCGLNIPQDVSVVGFDDSTLAVASGVKLTSMTHPKTEMGVLAARQLISMIEEQTVIEDTIYQPTLVERESVTKLK
ncbi:arabinose utilization transcriptional regulator AraR [Paenibacillus sp. JCM 10914]|uniref:GntR family transcriptional regulator n=1 Tax=Paenibacillus sp. JCM 10914 TaxID=1236974 RepID=UPI0003CC86A9|nr:GntR family transcriptional regulator [Paenibacillus sp. JCM 10914]GAE04072.1 transcriptional repressor of arabinoside utilization operon, GntR family [Paenibacillus sp. JCM 10914]